MFAAINTGTSFGPFFQLGIQHIFTGYDHLLFLLGLLLVCTRGPTLVMIVTCFTVGHSLALAMATLGWINLLSGVTEPLIALSILWVGVENIWRRGTEPAGRWALTLLFGLVHGFGFATVLRDLGVGTEGRPLLVPLFAFNLGVESGQLVFAAIALPLIWWLRRFPSLGARVVTILSGVVALAGFYWLVERVVFD